MVDRGKEIMLRVQEFAASLPFSPMSPDLVARAVLRAVKYDLAVVPVRTEAWLGYVLGRVAPGINRRTTQAFSIERAERWGAWALGKLDDLNLLPRQGGVEEARKPTAARR
jgi:hypothetical protein